MSLELAGGWTRWLILRRSVNLRRLGPDCCHGATAKLGQSLLQETCNTRQQH